MKRRRRVTGADVVGIIGLTCLAVGMAMLFGVGAGLIVVGGVFLVAAIAAAMWEGADGPDK